MRAGFNFLETTTGKKKKKWEKLIEFSLWLIHFLQTNIYILENNIKIKKEKPFHVTKCLYIINKVLRGEGG